jgi:hypothetical protein
MGSNGEVWEEAGVGGGVRRRKGGVESAGAGASSSFAEGNGEFVLRSMDARFSGSADDDELFVSAAASRQPGTFSFLYRLVWFLNMHGVLEDSNCSIFVNVKNEMSDVVNFVKRDCDITKFSVMLFI